MSITQGTVSVSSSPSYVAGEVGAKELYLRNLGDDQVWIGFGSTPAVSVGLLVAPAVSLAPGILDIHSAELACKRLGFATTSTGPSILTYVRA